MPKTVSKSPGKARLKIQCGGKNHHLI